jgi:hypothetical protein
MVTRKLPRLATLLTATAAVAVPPTNVLCDGGITHTTVPAPGQTGAGVGVAVGQVPAQGVGVAWETET